MAGGEVIYLPCGKDEPRSGPPHASGNVSLVFSGRWTSPNTRFILVVGCVPRQETLPQLEIRLMCDYSTEFLGFRLLLQVRNHVLFS